MQYNPEYKLLIGNLAEDTKLVVLRERAQQIAHLMERVNRYYADLGILPVKALQRSRPHTSARWQLDRLLRSGSLRDKGSLLIGAVRTNDGLQPVGEADGLVGLLAISKPIGPCTVNEHQPTEISDWYVMGSDPRDDALRSNGLGKAMMRAGLTVQTCHAEDVVMAKVPRDNPTAVEVIGHLGFWHNWLMPPRQMAPYNTQAVQYEIPALQLVGRLSSTDVIKDGG